MADPHAMADQHSDPAAMADPHADLDSQAIAAALDGTRFRDVEVHASLDSTQRLLLAEGGPDGRVVVADHQTSGRGRAGRTWSAEPGAGLLFSCLLRGVAPDRAPLLSLAGGLAVARACGAEARVKWPNDVLLGDAKVAGVLGELAPGGGSCVLGIGVNVRGAPEDLGGVALGGGVRRGDLLVAILRAVDELVDGLGGAGAPAWLDDYRRACASIGRKVRVELPGRTLRGTATGVRDDGALVVAGEAVLAGDVIHVRGTDT